jgi:hypothetical protein
MRFSLNTLTKILNCFRSRKALSSPRSTYLPNIFARRNPYATARSARLRAAKSAGRLRKQRLAAGGNNANRPSTKPRAPHYRRARTRPVNPLRRCNTTLAPPPATHPHMPGAYVLEPSFVVPRFPDVDDHHISPLVAQKLFLDSLYARRQAILRAAEERDAEAEAARWHAAVEDTEYAHLLEQDLRNARAAHLRAEEAEFARLLEEDRRKAEAAQRRAEDEDFARLLEEDRRKAQEAHRWAMEQEERRRAETMERERRERERREQERRGRENSSVAEIVQPSLAEQLRVYEENWDSLRGSNAVKVGRLGFCDIPWPVFENVRGVEDVTLQEFGLSVPPAARAEPGSW